MSSWTATRSVTGVSGSFLWSRISLRSSREGHLEEGRERPHLRVAPLPVRQARRPEDDGVRRDVLHEHVPRPVEDRAAGRLDRHRPLLVLQRRRAVLVRGEDLQRPEPEEEDAEDDEREHAEDGDAHRHLRGQEIRLLDLRVGREEAAERPLRGRASQSCPPPSRTCPARPAAAAGVARARRSAT